MISDSELFPSNYHPKTDNIRSSTDRYKLNDEEKKALLRAHDKSHINPKGKVDGVYLFRILENGHNQKSLPAKISLVSMEGLNDQERGILRTKIRLEYQRGYYQKHKEEAKKYQRQYSLTHKKKAMGKGEENFEASREVVRTTFNTSDIMQSPVEKTVKMLEKIISGERLFTM